MSTEVELEDRLQRLAPDIDLDQARTEQQTRQVRTARRRRQARAGVAVACVVVLVGAGAVANQAGDEGGQDAVTTDEIGQPVPPRSTTAVVDGIEITVTVPDQALAGSRLWFDVVVRNQRDTPAVWEAGGCAVPVRVVVGPAATTTLDDWPDNEPGDWNGDGDQLAASLADHNALSAVQSHQTDADTARRWTACTLDSPPTELAPGDSLSHHGSVELRMPPGELADDGRYVLVVGFPEYGVPARDATAQIQAPLTIVEDPARVPDSSEDAVDAFAADPRLAAWVAATQLPDRPHLAQTFTTELSWWREAWELWLTPYWEPTHLLRMRFDPATGEVVDVRSVRFDQAPEDEPDRATLPTEEPDEIL